MPDYTLVEKYTEGDKTTYVIPQAAGHEVERVIIEGNRVEFHFNEPVGTGFAAAVERLFTTVDAKAGTPPPS
jgi:hypothetical protein